MTTTHMAAASIAMLMLLPSTAVAQMIVIQQVGDLHEGGQQLILGGAPVVARPGGGPAVLLRLRQASAPPVSTALGGGLAAIQGFGSGEAALAGPLGVRPGTVFERSQSSVWMPRGDGRVQRQEVEEEKVSSDGLRQLRRVAREKLAQMEESVDDQADDEDYTKDGDADDDVQAYQDGLRKGTIKLRDATGRGERGSDSTDDDSDSMEFEIDESNPVKSMMQIMHARDTVEVVAQKDVTDSLIARAQAFEKRLEQQSLQNVAKRKALDGQPINTINGEVASHEQAV